MIHGYVDEIIEADDMEQKAVLIKKIVDHISMSRQFVSGSANKGYTVPGRYEEARLPSETETKDVGFIKLRIESASAKIRTGGPGDLPSVSSSANAVYVTERGV